MQTTILLSLLLLLPFSSFGFDYLLGPLCPTSKPRRYFQKTIGVQSPAFWPQCCFFIVMGAQSPTLRHDASCKNSNGGAPHSDLKSIGPHGPTLNYGLLLIEPWRAEVVWRAQNVKGKTERHDWGQLGNNPCKSWSEVTLLCSALGMVLGRNVLLHCGVDTVCRPSVDARACRCDKHSEVHVQKLKLCTAVCHTGC